MNKYLSYAFLAGGLGLIIAAFFLFLQDSMQENLFYLNLVISCLVFAVIFLRTTDIFGTVNDVAGSGGGLGLKWFATWMYIPLALLLVIGSTLLSVGGTLPSWGFNFCLIAHLVLLFGLLLFFFLGKVAQDNVNRTQATVAERKSVLAAVNSQLTQLELACSLRAASHIDTVRSLKEDIRFITASDNPSARAIEEQIYSRLRLITNQVEQGSQPADTIESELGECRILASQRKNIY